MPTNNIIKSYVWALCPDKNRIEIDLLRVEGSSSAYLDSRIYILKRYEYRNSCSVYGGQTTVIIFEIFNPLSILQNIVTR
jgi:hypothetical protein